MSQKPDISALLAPQDEASEKSHGLKPNEYQIILDRLGRKPNLVEMGIFSVMWSEHCSYKSTRRHLGKFPTKGPKGIQGPGENAGVVDIGDGQACVFKMESHNHPRFIEPYHVAGIGGYDNCVGVPTVGCETEFHTGYDGNILVNAMCVGLADANKIFLSAA